MVSLDIINNWYLNNCIIEDSDLFEDDLEQSNNNNDVIQDSRKERLESILSAHTRNKLLLKTEFIPKKEVVSKQSFQEEPTVNDPVVGTSTITAESLQPPKSTTDDNPITNIKPLNLKIAVPSKTSKIPCLQSKLKLPSNQNRKPLKMVHIFTIFCLIFRFLVFSKR